MPEVICIGDMGGGKGFYIHSNSCFGDDVQVLEPDHVPCAQKNAYKEIFFRRGGKVPNLPGATCRPTGVCRPLHGPRKGSGSIHAEGAVTDAAPEKGLISQDFTINGIPHARLLLFVKLFAPAPVFGLGALHMPMNWRWSRARPRSTVALCGLESDRVDRSTP